MMLDKLSSTARKLGTFFRILQRILIGVMIAIVVVMAVLSIVNAVKPDAVIGTALNELDIGALTLVLETEQIPDNGSILAYAWVSVAISVLWGTALCIGLHLLRRMLQPMGEGCPFHPDTARQIKKLAILSLVMGIVDNVASIVDAAMALRSYGLYQQTVIGSSEYISVNYSFDLSFLIVFFVLLLLSYLFSYGAELQRLSDETL